MKRDLTEFTQVVQHDTACTIAATASVVKEKLAVSTPCTFQAAIPRSLTYMGPRLGLPVFPPLGDCFSL